MRRDRVKLTVEVSREDFKRIAAAFQNSDLDELGVVGVVEEPSELTMEIDNPWRTDLVTRSGKPVVIESIRHHSASGTIDGRQATWSHSGPERFGACHTFLQHSDHPGENDVFAPIKVAEKSEGM